MEWIFSWIYGAHDLKWAFVDQLLILAYLAYRTPEFWRAFKASGYKLFPYYYKDDPYDHE